MQKRRYLQLGIYFPSCFSNPYSDILCSERSDEKALNSMFYKAKKLFKKGNGNRTFPNGSVIHLEGQACLLQIRFATGFLSALHKLSGTKKSSLIVLMQKISLD